MSTHRPRRRRLPARGAAGVLGGAAAGVVGGAAGAATVLLAGPRAARRRRDVEAVLADAARRSAAADAALGEVEQLRHQVVAGASHELRTSLTAVIGFAQLLRTGSVGPLNERQRELLGRLEASGHRQLRLVEDLLLLGQVDEGGLRLRTVPLDVRHVVRRSVTQAHDTLGRRRLRFSLETGADPLVAVVDEERLARVVGELVDNAVKFTADGGRIEVSCGRRGDRVVVAVADSGVGMTPDDVRRVAGRFVRGRGAVDAAVPGSGIGLAVVHDLVAAHGGTVHVDSRPGGGTRVEVGLPLAAGQEEDPSSAEMRATRTSSSNGLTR